MSRYTFTGNRPNLRIVVGWDRPLETYFAQVWDGGDVECGKLLLWVGAEFQSVPSVEALRNLLSPFGELPEEIARHLREEECEPPERLTPYDLLSGRK